MTTGASPRPAPTRGARAARPDRPLTRDPTDVHPGWLLFRGAIAIVFGVLAMVMPLATIGSLVLLFAAYLLADGAVAAIATFRALRRGAPWGGLALEALANVAAGAVALAWPGITVIVLVWLAGLWAIVSGAFMAWAGWQSTAPRGRWLRVLAGALSLVWGLLLLIAPLPGALVMTLWLGAYAIVFGVALLVAGWRARHAAAAPR